MADSPPGTPGWFGWANAVISELVPVAALLVVRRRRRAGQPVGYPMFLLICAVALSLSAQLAVAKPGVSGWLLSAVPALAFLGLSKLVFTLAPAGTAGGASLSPVSRPSTWSPVRPSTLAAQVDLSRGLPSSSDGPGRLDPRPASASRSVAKRDRSSTPPDTRLPDETLRAARAVADQLAGQGRRVTRDALAAQLRAQGHRVSTSRAGSLVKEMAELVV